MEKTATIKTVEITTTTAAVKRHLNESIHIMGIDEIAFAFSANRLRNI